MGFKRGAAKAPVPTAGVRSRSWARPIALAALVVTASCGSDGDPTDPGGGEWGRPGGLLGSWQAIKVEHRGQANPELVTDLIERNAVFTLDVRGGGDYTAVLDFLVNRTEVGVLRVEGPRVTFRPTGGTENTNSFQLRGDTAVLIGPSKFDVDDDAQDEETVLTLELVPR